MIQWTPFPFLRFAATFGLGILFEDFFSLGYYQVIVCVLLIAYLFLFLSLKRKIYTLNLLFGTLGLAILFTAGAGIYRVGHEKENPSYNSEFSSPGSQFLIWADQEIIETKSGTRTVANIIAYKYHKDWIHCNYKILIISDSTIQLQPGDLFLLKSNPHWIKSGKGDFDFRKYYEHQGIYLNEYVNSLKIVFAGRKEIPTIRKWAFEVRNRVSENIAYYFGSTQQSAILKAITVGQKNEISNEVKQDFASTGTMHVLAVSGLHVGIFYGIFLFLFKGFLESRFKLFFITILIIVLWFYALITGFTPSVIRAVTMFSFLAAGKAFGRKGNAYNLLFTSAFILLVLNPDLLFMVGFQLSYCAVLSILYFAPKFINLPHPLWIPNKIWILNSVSLAAQLGTFPLTLYYFKQFPTYFLISNMIVIPLVFLILNGAIFFLASGILKPLQEILGFLIEKLVSLMLFLVKTVNLLPFNILKTQTFSSLDTISLYGFMFSITAFLLKRDFKILLFALAVLLAFSISRFFSIYVFFHK